MIMKATEQYFPLMLKQSSLKLEIFCDYRHFLTNVFVFQVHSSNPFFHSIHLCTELGNTLHCI